MRTWIRRIAIGIVAVVVIAVLLGVDFVRSFARSVPIYDGSVMVRSVSAPVQILRDKYAVPHIFAASFQDAAFGLGYAHA